MPRRIPDYPDAFAHWNAVSSFGSIISVMATVLFGYIIYDIFASYSNKETEAIALPRNVWATPSYFMTLQVFTNNCFSSNNIEWTLPTPTPFHAYDSLPIQS